MNSDDLRELLEVEADVSRPKLHHVKQADEARLLRAKASYARKARDQRRPTINGIHRRRNKHWIW